MVHLSSFSALLKVGFVLSDFGRVDLLAVRVHTPHALGNVYFSIQLLFFILISSVLNWVRALYYHLLILAYHGHKSGLTLVVLFVPFCCHSTFVPFFFRFAPAQKLHTLSSVVRVVLHFKKDFFVWLPSVALFHLIFLKTHSRILAGAQVVYRITHPALQRNASVLPLCALHSDRHPATRSFPRSASTTLTALTWGVIMKIWAVARTCATQSPLGYQHTAVYCSCTFGGIACLQIKQRCAGFFLPDSKQT